MWKTGGKILKGKAKAWKILVLGLLFLSFAGVTEFVGRQLGYTSSLAATLLGLAAVTIGMGLRAYIEEIEFDREKARLKTKETPEDTPTK